MPTGVYIRTEEHKRKISETMKGYIPWNKDLTKETDERVAKNARNTSKALKGTYHKAKRIIYGKVEFLLNLIQLNLIES